MMLRGEKPLSVFADAKNHFSPVLCRYLRMFDRHWAAGTLVRDEDVRRPELGLNYSLHTIYYALPGEEWRITAMMELRRSQRWSLDHERREGELLGYTDWQIDWFIDWMKRRQDEDAS